MIYDAKRLTGRSYHDEQVSKDRELWPFEVVEGENSRPMFKLNVGGEERKFYPEEIQAKILQKMKQCAEKKTETTIRDAVITVPAYFNDT